jgi:integration host factor subunit beta
MTKSGLIEKLVTHYKSLPPAGVEKAVNTLFDGMTDELARGGRIEVRGFGSFSVRHRRAKQGRNPKTGATIAVPPKRVPFFTTGVDLAKRVDEGRLKYGAAKDTSAANPDNAT